MNARRAAPLPEESPRDKIRPILRAARAVFMEHGYGAASMDEVARVAGVSKATLYVYFAGKRDLFAAIISEERDRYAGSMLAGETGREHVRVRLIRFGRAIVEFLLSPDTVASYRMVVAEAGRHPELGQEFHAHGPAKFLDRLEEFMERAMRSGALRAAEPRRAAEQLLGLVRGDLQLVALLGVTKGLSRERIDAVIRAGVDTFYRAYRPEAVRLARLPAARR